MRRLHTYFSSFSFNSITRRIKTRRTESTEQGMSLPPLSSRVNPTTGRTEWVIEDENYDFTQEIARSAYTDMLHDAERNKKYYEGIKRAVQKFHSDGKKAHVLDIGTGTGLLSMMSAACGADTVHACEAFDPIGKVARKIVSRNGFADNIKIICKRSTELTVGPKCDLPQRCNILPAEVFDTELIGEGAIPTYLHAHRHLLTEDSICVPHSATIYAQLFHSDFLSSLHRLKPVVLPEIDDIIPHPEMERCSGAASVYDVQLSELSHDHFVPVTEPIRMLALKFSECNFGGFGQRTEKATIINNGMCHGVFMWWELQMDTEGEVTLSTAPKWAHPHGNAAQWRDHWMQAVYFLDNTLALQKGDLVDVCINHDDYSIWFNVGTKSDPLKPTSERPVCTCGAHVVWSRPHFGMLNDSSRTEKYFQVLKQIIKPNKACMSISDGSMLPLMMSRLQAEKVFAIEANPMSQRVMKKLLKANDLQDKIHLLDEVPDSETCKQLFGPNKIDVLVGDPFFINSILPWHNLYFWYARTAIKDHLSKDFTVLPMRARLRAVAVEFDHLWKFHAPVGSIEGFDVTLFDDLTQKAIKDTDAATEPHHLWEYPGQPLTQDFDLMSFEFTECVPESIMQAECEIAFTCSGTCHGVALWMDFDLTDSITSTTGLTHPVKDQDLRWSKHFKQGIHFMRRNPQVTYSDKLICQVTFNPETGNLHFSFEVR